MLAWGATVLQWMISRSRVPNLIKGEFRYILKSYSNSIRLISSISMSLSSNASKLTKHTCGRISETQIYPVIYIAGYTAERHKLYKYA